MELIYGTYSHANILKEPRESPQCHCTRKLPVCYVATKTWTLKILGNLAVEASSHSTYCD